MKIGAFFFPVEGKEGIKGLHLFTVLQNFNPLVSLFGHELCVFDHVKKLLPYKI